MRLVIDIDGTICSQEEDYNDAKPFRNRINTFNQLFNAGNEVVYFTARGTETGIDWRELTEKQFKLWGVKYTKLMFGKPGADVYIDDKAFNPEEDLKHCLEILELKKRIIRLGGKLK